MAGASLKPSETRLKFEKGRVAWDDRTDSYVQMNGRPSTYVYELPPDGIPYGAGRIIHKLSTPRPFSAMAMMPGNGRKKP